MKKLITFMLAGLITSFFLLQSSAWSKSALLMQLPSILAASNQISASSVVNDNVIIIDENSVPEIVAISANTGINGEVGLTLSGKLAERVTDGSILYILPGSDDRFPFGINGEVIGSFYVDEMKIVFLQHASYSETTKEAESNLSDISLNASNLIGVIAPSGVQAASPVSMVAKSSSIYGGEVYSFRNGAIVVGAAKREGMLRSNTESNAIDAGNISLNIKVDLADMGIDASRMRPVNSDLSVGFEITGELNDIKITNNYDFSLLDGGLKTLDLRMDSDLMFDVKFNGIGSVKFGYFSQAWKEVEEEFFKAFGVSAKLVGLSSEDKIEKYPIAGLVFSLPCPPEKPCFVRPGKTQTPLRMAKAGGVIVWLYLTIDGEFSLDGNLTLARLNPAGLSVGINKSSKSDFQLISSLTKKNDSDCLLEFLKLDGKAGFQSHVGITTDVDFFASGVRLVNVGVDAVGLLKVEATGKGGFCSDSLGSIGNWEGEMCVSGGFGAGLISRASAKIGIEIDTGWKDISGNLEYKFQMPSEDDIDVPGRHGAWYFAGFNTCAVNPIITQTPLSGPPKTTFIQSGTGFTPNSIGTMHFRKPDGTEYPTAQQAMDSTGHFSINYTAPSDKPAGNYTWWVVDGPTGVSSNEVTYTITAPAVNPAITQTPMSGLAGTTFAQSGTGFTPNSTGTMHFRKPDGTEYPTAQQAMDSTGHFSINYTAPADKPAGDYTWWVVDGPTGVSSNQVTYTITAPAVNPTIAQTPMSGTPGTTFSQWGTGFTPNSTGTMHFRKPDGTEYPTAQQAMDSTGHFSINYTAPMDKPAGNYTWWVVDGPTGVSSNQVTYTITAPAVNPTIAQTPMSGPQGTTFAQWGTGFTPNSTGTMHFRKPDGTEYPTAQQAMDSTGHFDITYTAPTSKAPGNYTWWVVDGPTGVSSNQVTYTVEVKPVIAQTPMSGPPGTTFAQWGTGFTPNSTGTMHFRKPDGTEYPTAQQTMDSIGHFDITYTAPSNKPAGNYTWWVIDGPTGKLSNQVTYTIQ